MRPTVHNAVFAALPLCLWLGHLTRDRLIPGAQPARPIAAALGAGTLLVMMGVNSVIAKQLIDDRETYPAHQVMVHDLIGISVSTGSVLLPSFYADTALPFSAIACLYSPNSAVAAFSGDYGRCPVTLRKLTRARDVAALRTAWLSAIRDHPRAYAAHRWEVWREQMALGVERVHYPLQNKSDLPDNQMGIDTRLTPRQDRALQLFTVAAYRTPLFRAWIYLLISVGVLLIARRLTADPVPLVVLGASAVLYELAYIVVSTASDFRFNWWSILAALVAVVMVVPRRLPAETTVRRA